MPRLREEFDSDLITTDQPAEYKSTINRFAVPCSVCGKSLFVDEETKREFNRAMSWDSDYTLTCLDCDQELDGLAYEYE